MNAFVYASRTVNCTLGVLTLGSHPSARAITSSATGTLATATNLDKLAAPTRERPVIPPLWEEGYNRTMILRRRASTRLDKPTI
ncbi:MAG: hypothetical protein ACHQKY_13200 [Terriglobia bacterium]